MGLPEDWASNWSAHDVEALAELFTVDCEYEDVAFKLVNDGHDGVRNWAAGFLGSFPDLVVVPGRSFQHADQAVLEWAMSGTHEGEFDGLSPTHRRFRIRGVTVFDLAEERIRKCADYWNLGDVHRQLKSDS